MLLEEQCKGLDFSLATERAHSVNAIHDPDAADLCKLFHMKSELETDSIYLEMISQLLTYATLTSNDLASNFKASFGAEAKTTPILVKDKVINHLFSIIIYYNALFVLHRKIR